MTSWVLPGILSADDVQKIPVEALVEMSKTSTGIIINYVNKFVASNIESDDPTLRQAAETMKAAYEEINRINEYLTSDEAKALSDTLCSMEYRDISAEVSLEKLIVMRSTILELLSEDEDFVKSYTSEIGESATHGMKTAYTVKLDEDNMFIVCRNMRAICGNQQSYAGLELVSAMERNSNLFKNSRTKLNSPTVLRKAIYKKDKLKSILRGIDYLIKKKQGGDSPVSWRKV